MTCCQKFYQRLILKSERYPIYCKCTNCFEKENGTMSYYGFSPIPGIVIRGYPQQNRSSITSISIDHHLDFCIPIKEFTKEEYQMIYNKLRKFINFQ